MISINLRRNAFGEVSSQLKTLIGIVISYLSSDLAAVTEYSSDFYPTLQLLPQTLGSYILKYLDDPYSKILTVSLRIEGAGAN